MTMRHWSEVKNLSSHFRSLILIMLSPLVFVMGYYVFSYVRENDNKKSNIIFLWNPSIRVSMILPSPCIKKCDTLTVVGFGFDSNINDYKVVRIVYDRGVNTIQVPTKLSTGAWRCINGIVQYVVAETSSRVFMIGAVHWLGYRCTEVNKSMLSVTVVVFDIGNEIFWEIKFPGCFCSLDLTNMYLLSKGKTLSWIEIHILQSRYYIWEMEEYGVIEGWRKRFTIDLSLLIPIGRSLGFRKNGELLLGKSFGALILYNLKTQEIISFRLDKPIRVDIYMESLFLMRGAKQSFGASEFLRYC